MTDNGQGTTAATPAGNCHQCGGQLYENLFHSCTTSVAPSVSRPTGKPDGTNEPVYERFTLTLEWFCVACGWRTTVDAPGFAGDGVYHYPSVDSPGGGQYPCGPLFARRAFRAGGGS